MDGATLLQITKADQSAVMEDVFFEAVARLNCHAVSVLPGRPPLQYGEPLSAGRVASAGFVRRVLPPGCRPHG